MTAFAKIASRCILVSLAAVLVTVPLNARKRTPTYLDTTKSWEERADDLLKRLTLKEKVSLLRYDSPAIDRLGIPEYNHWNESLHGVARAGKATVFPQAIGLAAMRDDSGKPDTVMMYRIACAISDEARAKHHYAASQGQRGIYQGLTFFAPNINIFRDPRWGRGMETYGEDPALTGSMAVAYIKGMQGDDPRYMKTIATAKHFAVHSGPEYNRHSFNVNPSEYDFEHTYAPQFKRAILDGGVYSVMCAYNSVDSLPCCGNKALSDILRNEWGLKGYIVSDCWAIKDFYQEEAHNLGIAPPAAAAMAVKAGTDLNCGDTYRMLAKAEALGYITEEEIDVSVKRILVARMRLGQFDPDSLNPYSSIPYSVVECEQHVALAAEAARKSMVLLKNDTLEGKKALPLSKEIKKIAVIGPDADAPNILLGNYNGVPSHIVTPLEGIKAKLPDAEVLYARGCPLAEGMPEGGLLREDGDAGHVGNGVPLDAEKIAALRREALSAASKADVVILCMGLSPQLEGEEMPVKIEGFNGGDRTTLDLPSVQENLIKDICALGKPTILVLLNGSALSINWEAEHIPAILEAWYPGQQGGTAIADVLFGDFNPNGKLPVTFYKSVTDLPPFEDYSMEGRTHLYFKGEPLFPFGYGLSY